jgi:methionine-rich copper-binding protein CopC
MATPGVYAVGNAESSRVAGRREHRSSRAWPVVAGMAGRRGRGRSSRARPVVVSALLILGLVVLALVAPAIASAHAGYKSSDPPAGAVVKTAPSVVTVHFEENVNPQGSDIIIYDATRKQVSTAPAQVSRADLTTMTLPMNGDGDGTYLVEWHTVSADDGDPDIGGFTFTVNAKAVAQATPAATQHGNAAGGGSGGAPVWLTVLIGLAGLALGGAGGVYAARRPAA